MRFQKGSGRYNILVAVKSLPYPSSHAIKKKASFSNLDQVLCHMVTSGVLIRSKEECPHCGQKKTVYRLTKEAEQIITDMD